MRSVTVRLDDLRTTIINLGFVGENEHKTIRFDSKKMFEEYPDAAASLTVVPPAGEAYPAIIERDGDIVAWTITDSDLTAEGDGEIQLAFTSGEVVAKTYIGKTRTCRALVPTGEIPSGLDDFLTRAGAILDEVEDAIPEGGTTGQVLAKKSNEDYDLEWVDQTGGGGGTSDYSQLTNKPQIAGVTLNGNKTLHDLGAASEEAVNAKYTKPSGGIPSTDLAEGVQTSLGKADTAYQKPVSGIPASDMASGSIPDPTEIIDDTAGDGDTNKVWSADKSSALLTEINSVHQVPPYGSTDQVLAKNSGTDYDLKWVTLSGGGTVDDALSDSSTNPVQNKVITGVINQISDKNVSPNLYDKNSCHPQDKTVYGNSHNYQSNNSYAVTGKTPVEPSTQYIFYAGENVNIKYVTEWSGEDGATFVKETNISGAAFTTGANTTFLDFEIFARSHTTDEYNAAINAAMLVKGNVVPSEYQPYGKVTYTIPTDALNDAEAVEGAKNYTVMKSLVNLYDKTLAQDNKVFNTNKLVDSTAYAFSGLIPVEPNAQYCYSIQKGLEYGYISAWYQRWDSSKAFIDEVQGNQSTNFLNQIQTTANTAYVSFCIYFGASHTTEAFNTAIDTLMVVEGCQQPAEYVPYNLEPVMNHLKMDTMYRDNADRFKGKKWLVTGTSVSYQDSKYYTEGVAEGEVVRGYIGNIARRKPMLITNVAVSGSTLAGSDTNALINRYQNLNMGSYDFITIEYGINDFGNNVPVGTASDAAGTESFAACLKTIIEYALNQNPIVGLIICTDPDVRGTTTNQNGNTLKDYADVMLEIAAQYRLPVCDWFYHSGINSITKGDGTSRYFLTQAGTHPSVYGHMRMGAMLNQVFDSLLC